MLASVIGGPQHGDTRKIKAVPIREFLRDMIAAGPALVKIITNAEPPRIQFRLVETGAAIDWRGGVQTQGREFDFALVLEPA